ncbi:MAG: NAD-binding protein [Planctomycetota bacterium]
MPIPRIEDLRQEPPKHRSATRWWSEWCFFKTCAKHFRVRAILMAVILITGGVLFCWLEPEKNHSFLRAMYYTFSLIFGEPPEEFPTSRVLQSLFFIVPILGLTVIIEGIIDFALIIRDRKRFERSWCTMLASSYSNHVVLVGFGRLGFRAYELLRKLGEPVVVIEKDPQNEFLEVVRRDRAPLLIGDARRDELLIDANIKKAKSIVLATDQDLVNLETALDARKYNPDVRVVLRMFDQNVADKVSDGFNLHLAMSQSALSAPTFATCAIAPATISSVIVGDQLIAMQRWLVREDGPLNGRTVCDIMREHHITIVEHRRPNEPPVMCPGPDVTLSPGDGVILQGPLERLESFRDGLEAVNALAMDAASAN